MSSPIGYNYQHIDAITTAVHANTKNMVDTVSAAMQQAKSSFDSMDANSKEAMQASFNKVMTTGQNAIGAIHSVNVATGNANTSMQGTDSGQISRFT